MIYEKEPIRLETRATFARGASDEQLELAGLKSAVGDSCATVYDFCATIHCRSPLPPAGANFRNSCGPRRSVTLG